MFPKTENHLRIITLIGCVAVIISCAAVWRRDLFLKALLPGTAILAFVHYLFVYCPLPLPAQIRSRITRMDRLYLAADLMLLTIGISVIYACRSTVLDDPAMNLVSVSNLDICSIPSSASPATLLALWDVLYCVLIFAGFISIKVLFLVTRRCHHNITLAVALIGMEFTIGAGILAFMKWINVFESYEHVASLLPGTEAIYSQMTLVAMITMACYIVAAADCSGMVEKWYEYLIVMMAASLDLAPTFAWVVLWWMIHETIQIVRNKQH